MEKLMIRTINSKTGFLRAAFVAGVGCASLLSMNAFAQEPTPAGEATAERIVVTGSNIPTAEQVLASPLDTVTTQDIKIAGGTSDVLTILQKRNPDFVGGGNLGGSNANIASGATQGGSIISLRGLPTLVLFEGRRISDSAAISAGGFQFTDVSIFPTALISRIEVLKDGASALYGSEAVGGVVNIFLKKDFEGVEIDGRYGFTPSSAVSERRVSAIAGLGNDTTHITVGFQYYEIDPLFNRERGYSRPFVGGTTTFPGGGRDNKGGGTSFYVLNPGLNSPFDAPGVTPGSIPPPAAGTANQGQYGQIPQAYTQVPSLSPLFDLSKLPTTTLDISNTNAYASVEHQIFGKQLELFSNFLYAKNHNESFLNGQPLNNGTGVIILGSQRVDPNSGLLVPEDRGAPAPFNPFQLSIDGNTLGGQYRLFANQRFQNKPRRFDDDSSFYRILVGLRSQITKDWTVETAAYYSNDSIDFVNSNLVNATQLNAAIAGTATDFGGTAIPPLDYFAKNVVGTGPGQLTG
ncbi:MAG: TonB-dependent receptor plug domain-containing protein, partial [Chthoniobacterales bacterium]